MCALTAATLLRAAFQETFVPDADLLTGNAMNAAILLPLRFRRRFVPNADRKRVSKMLPVTYPNVEGQVQTTSILVCNIASVANKACVSGGEPFVPFSETEGQVYQMLSAGDVSGSLALGALTLHCSRPWWIVSIAIFHGNSEKFP